jgi:hypothetical protein
MVQVPRLQSESVGSDEIGVAVFVFDLCCKQISPSANSAMFLHLE